MESDATLEVDNDGEFDLQSSDDEPDVELEPGIIPDADVQAAIDHLTTSREEIYMTGDGDVEDDGSDGLVDLEL
jgi:hypothetical protein